MKFDPPLAKAELNRASLLLSHHLRQIEIDGDVTAAKYFVKIITRLQAEAIDVRWRLFADCRMCDRLAEQSPNTKRQDLHAQHRGETKQSWSLRNDTT